MLKIVYEDEWIIVVDKPSGLLVIPTPRDERVTLTSILNKELDRRGVEVNAYPCHRLDRETSGLIIYAKGKRIRQRMTEEFRKRSVKKIYLAVVHGIVEKDFGIIKNPIYNRNKKVLEDAVTKYRVAARRRDHSILEVEPVTGRTNQIRIHLKAIGHPIVGESVYAFRKDYELKFRRTALHARYVEFNHPAAGGRASFEAPLPEDMRMFEINGRDT